MLLSSRSRSPAAASCSPSRSSRSGSSDSSPWPTVKHRVARSPPSTLRMACVSARSSRGFTCTSSDCSYEILRGEKPVAVAAGHDDDGVGRDSPVLGASGLQAEAPLQIEQRRGVAVGIDPVQLQPRRLGAVRREQGLQRLFQGLARSGDDPDVDRLLQAVERLDRRLAGRPAAVLRPVPAREMAGREHVDQDRQHDGRGQAAELQRLRPARRAHPHLQASTARVATNSGSTVRVP